MFFKLEEKDIEKLKEAEEITCTDFGIEGDMILADNVLVALDEMIYRYHVLEEEFEDYKEKENMTADDYFVDGYIEEEKLKNFEF